MSAAFRDKAQRFIWEVFGDDVYEEQYKYPGKRDEQVQQDTCQTGTDTQWADKQKTGHKNPGAGQDNWRVRRDNRQTGRDKGRMEDIL